MSDPRREASQKSQPPRATHTIRFSDSEWRTVLDLADATGRKPTAFVRESALGQRLRRRPKARHLDVVEAAAEALAEHDRQLARIGNNLNQLTRLAHVGRVRHGEDFLHVLGRVERELKASRAEIRGALAPFVEAENSHEHRGEDFLHVLGSMERESTVPRAEFRGAPAPFVEAENSHERQGAPSVEATVPESAGGRTR